MISQHGNTRTRYVNIPVNANSVLLELDRLVHHLSKRVAIAEEQMNLHPNKMDSPTPKHNRPQNRYYPIDAWVRRPPKPKQTSRDKDATQNSWRQSELGFASYRAFFLLI